MASPTTANNGDGSGTPETMETSPPASQLPPPRSSPPPTMPLPALPLSKKRLPDIPRTSEDTRESIYSTPPSSASLLRKPTPSGLARLKMPAVQSSTNLSTQPTGLGLSNANEDPHSADSPARGPEWARRSFRKTVSIGSFPQPPKGGIRNFGSNSSSSGPGSPGDGQPSRIAAPRGGVSPLLASAKQNELSGRRASETKIAGDFAHLVDDPERRSSEPLVTSPAPAAATIPSLARGSTLSTSKSNDQISAVQVASSVARPINYGPRGSSLPSATASAKRSVSAASGIPKVDRLLHVPEANDSRPGSSHGSTATDGTHFEDVDPPTPTKVESRLSQTGSIRSLRSVKSVGNLRERRGSLIAEEQEEKTDARPIRHSSTTRTRPRARASDVPSIRSVRSTKSSGTLRDSFGKDGKGNVVVSVRVRPNTNSPDPSAPASDWLVEGRQASISYKGGEGGDFRYDNVFTANDDNGRVYDNSAKRLVRRVMEGYHGTVFAYGITGTGKTFSMQGTAQSPGIIPLAITDIFSYIREHPSREFLLRVSYLEIYNEKIFDLLSSGDGGAQDEIKLREDSKRGVYAYPLKEEIVQSPTQLLRVIARGDVARRTGSTQFNVRSSRSHAVVQIVVESRERSGSRSPGKGNLPGGVLVSTLSLIDLAGSERAAEDKNRRTEGSHINKSLLTLGTVVGKLAVSKDSKGSDSKHLPYRDSKLTRLLQSALSGGALISILCTVQISAASTQGAAATPVQGGATETLNTLKFASRAKNNIVSHAKKNESLPGVNGEARALLDRYKAEIEDLRKQLEGQNQGQSKAEVVMDEEEQERWLEREREAAERHEEQLLEMQLARTALKERIGHLNRLILSSKSAGVNAPNRAIPQLIKDKRPPRPDEVGVAMGSPEFSRKSSIASTAMETSSIVPSIKPSLSRNVSVGSTSATGLSNAAMTSRVATVEEDDLDHESSDEFGEASLATQNRALQADLADKNRYIGTLERRLLEARRTSRSQSYGHGRRSLPGSGDDVLAEKDREIAELRARLDDQTKMVNALRSAARRRDMVDVRSTPSTPMTPAVSSFATPASASTSQSPDKKRTATTPPPAVPQPLATIKSSGAPSKTSSPVDGRMSPRSPQSPLAAAAVAAAAVRHKRSGDAITGATTSVSGPAGHRSQLSQSSTGSRSVNFSRLTPVGILDGGRSRGFSDASTSAGGGGGGGGGGDALSSEGGAHHHHQHRRVASSSNGSGLSAREVSGVKSLDEMTALLDGMIQAKARDDVGMRFGGSMMLRENGVAPLMIGN